MKWWGNLWRQICEVYTVTALLLILLNLMIAGSLSATVIDAGAFLWVLAFAVCFALANELGRASFLPRWGGRMLHFLLVILGAFLFLYLPNGRGTTASGKLIMVCIMVTLYWIGVGIRRGILLLFRKAGTGRERDHRESSASGHSQEKETYQPLFRK